MCRVRDGGFSVQAVGQWSVLDFEKGKPVALRAVSPSEFQSDAGERTRLGFAGDKVVLNPGPWQIEGVRVRGE